MMTTRIKLLLTILSISSTLLLIVIESTYAFTITTTTTTSASGTIFKNNNEKQQLIRQNKRPWRQLLVKPFYSSSSKSTSMSSFSSCLYVLKSPSTISTTAEIEEKADISISSNIGDHYEPKKDEDDDEENIDKDNILIGSRQLSGNKIVNIDMNTGDGDNNDNEYDDDDDDDEASTEIIVNYFRRISGFQKNNDNEQKQIKHVFGDRDNDDKELLLESNSLLSYDESSSFATSTNTTGTDLTKILRETFDMFDIDKNGLIDKYELKQVMTKLQQQQQGQQTSSLSTSTTTTAVDDNEIEKMISLVDLNNDGQIDFNEFLLSIDAKSLFINLQQHQQQQQERKMAPTAEEARAPITDELRQYQNISSNIALSFNLSSQYNPLPLLTNEHLQTISGVFLRNEINCAYVVDTGIIAIRNIINSISNIRKKSKIVDDNDDNDNDDPTDESICTFWDERIKVNTLDADFFHVDVKYYNNINNDINDSSSFIQEQKQQENDSNSSSSSNGSSISKGLVVLIHGLESNSNSSLSLDMAISYIQNGFDVACINHRGCCGNSRTSPGAYHLGFTDDLRYFLDIITSSNNDVNMNNNDWIRNKFTYDNTNTANNKEIFLSGFSLGANIVLKLLGELGTEAQTRYNIVGAAVTGAPFNNELNNKRLEGNTLSFNKFVYSNRFLKSMKTKLKEKLDDEECILGNTNNSTSTSEEDDNYERCLLANSVAEFETEYIAKRYGYVDNIDYYAKTSCYYFLDSITVPTLIINAADDPFFDKDFFPFDKSTEYGGYCPIKFIRTDHGGHLGYMFHQPTTNQERNDIIANNNLLQQQQETIKKASSSSENNNKVNNNDYLKKDKQQKYQDQLRLLRRPSWMPNELGRFLNHVHTTSQKKII